MTVAAILEGIGGSRKEFTIDERKAIAAMAGIASPSAADPSPMAELEFRGLLLDKLLAAITGKPAVEVVAAEVLKRPKRPSAAVKRVPKNDQASGTTLASTLDVGTFLLKHGLDGRPIKPGSRAKPETFVAQRDTALSLVFRRDDFLVVVLARLMDDPPQGVGEALRDRIDHALDSLPPGDSPPKNRPRTRR